MKSKSSSSIPEVSQWPSSWLSSPVGSSPCPAFENLPGLIPSPFFRKRPTRFSTRWAFLFFIPAIFCLLGPHLACSRILKLANLFFGALLVSSAFFFFLGMLGLKALTGHFQFTFASSSGFPFLARNQSSSITGFLALGLGVLLLSLIPQFQYSLEKEIGLDEPESKLPKLFPLRHPGRNQVDSLLETAR